MNKTIILIIVLFLPIIAIGQITSAEMTVSLEDKNEILTLDEGFGPPDTDVSAKNLTARIRLRDLRKFPVFEMSWNYESNYNAGDTLSLKMAGIYPLIKGKLTAKVLYTSETAENEIDDNAFGGCLFGHFDNLNIAAAMDNANVNDAGSQIYSLRGNYKMGPVNLMAGYSTNPEDIGRFTAGALLDLPRQFMLGGLIGQWEDETGFCVNIGRYNKRGDFAGLPSFALNHLEVPDTYIWTSFRIMWGESGLHYVRPTFGNDVFSGMLDLDVALMLSELVPDNFRHFDSPLLFLRYDEYGKLAVRANYLDTEGNYRRFDANVSYNTGWEYGLFKSVRTIVACDRIHNPAFGWQPDRYHFTAASYLFGKVYTGVTYSSDFDEFNDMLFELRLITAL